MRVVRVVKDTKCCACSDGTKCCACSDDTSV